MSTIFDHAARNAALAGDTTTFDAEMDNWPFSIRNLPGAIAEGENDKFLKSSGTSHVLTTGTKSFQLDTAVIHWEAGLPVVILERDTGNPAHDITHLMTGHVAVTAIGTNTLQVEITKARDTSGGAFFTAWKIYAMLSDVEVAGGGILGQEFGGFGVNMQASGARLAGLEGVYAGVDIPIDAIVSDPSLATTDGYNYLIGNSAVGVFAGREDQIAARRAGSYYYYVPRPGWCAYATANLGTFPGLPGKKSLKFSNFPGNGNSPILGSAWIYRSDIPPVVARSFSDSANWLIDADGVGWRNVAVLTADDGLSKTLTLPLPASIPGVGVYPPIGTSFEIAAQRTSSWTVNVDGGGNIAESGSAVSSFSVAGRSARSCVVISSSSPHYAVLQ